MNKKKTLCVTKYCIFMNKNPSVLNCTAYSWTKTPRVTMCCIFMNKQPSVLHCTAYLWTKNPLCCNAYLWIKNPLCYTVLNIHEQKTICVTLYNIFMNKNPLCYTVLHIQEQKTICVTLYNIFMNKKPSVLHCTTYSWTKNHLCYTVEHILNKNPLCYTVLHIQEQKTICITLYYTFMEKTFCVTLYCIFVNKQQTTVMPNLCTGVCDWAIRWCCVTKCIMLKWPEMSHTVPNNPASTVNYILKWMLCIFVHTVFTRIQD